MVKRLSLVMFGLLGCRTPAPTPVATDEPEAPAIVEPEAPPRMPDPLPAVTSAVQMLPPDTLVAFQAATGRRIFEVLQRDEFASVFPDEFDKFSRESRSAFGTDLTTVDGWKEIGADPEGPAGFALLSVEHEAGCVWLTATDTVKMRRTIFDLAGKFGTELRPMSIGAAEVLRTGRDVSFVLRDKLVFLVLTDRRSTVDFSHALAIAKPRTSLAATVGEFTGSDLRGHVNFRALAEDMAREELANFERWGEKNPSRRRRIERQSATLNFLLEGFPAVDLHADATDDEIIAKATATVTKGAFPLPVLSGPADPKPLLRAMNGRLLLFGSGSVDVKASVKAIDTLARGVGESWADVVAEGKRLGVDVDAEVLPLLTGRASAGLTLTRKPPFRDLDVPRGIDFAIAIGVTDEAKTMALVDRAARVVGATKHKKTGLWKIAADGLDVFIGAADGNLIVTTDSALPGRMRAGTVGTLRNESSPLKSITKITGGEPSLIFAHDFAPWVWAEARLGPSHSRFGKGIDPTRKHPKRMAAKLAKLERKVDKLEKKHDVARLNSLFAIVDALGMQVYTLREDGNDLVLEGTHTLRAKDWAVVVDNIGTAVRQDDELRNSPERRRLVDEQRELRDELRALDSRE